MSISNLSSAAVEHAPPQVVAFNRVADNKSVEAKNGTQARSIDGSSSNTYARSSRANASADVKSAHDAQVLRFDADKLASKAQHKTSQTEQETESSSKPPKEAELKQALDLTNQLSSLQVRQLQFTASEEDGRTVIKVLDKENKEVIRQIPSEEFVKMAQRINDLTEELNSAQGILFESKV